jgi:hypothetical protein
MALCCCWVFICDGLVDHWCTDVSLMWRKPNRNSSPYFTTTTYATAVYYHQGTGVLHHQGTGVLHHQGTGVLHHQGTGVIHHQAPEYYSVPIYYTDAPAYYATKGKCYTESLKYYSAQIYYTAAAPSCYVGPKYYAEVLITKLQRLLHYNPRPYRCSQVLQYQGTRELYHYSGSSDLMHRSCEIFTAPSYYTPRHFWLFTSVQICR